MKLDDSGSSVDSTTPGDTVDETGRNQSGRDQVPVPDSARNHPMSREAMFAGASRGLEGAADAPSVSSGDASSGSRPADSSVASDAAADTVDSDAGGKQGGAEHDGNAEGTGPAGQTIEDGEITGIAEGLPRDLPDSGNGQLNDRGEGQAAVLPDAGVPRWPTAPREGREDSGTLGEAGDLTGTRPAFGVIDAQAEERGDEPVAGETGTSRRPEGRAAPARDSQEGTESASGDRAEPETEDAEKTEAVQNDQPADQDRRSLDANPAQPDETGPEASPDARLDDQRPLTVADAKAMIAEALAESNAKHEAELDEQKVKHEAETEELKGRISTLEAKVEGGQEDQAEEQLLPGDRTPEDDTWPDVPDTADERSAEQRGDRLPRGTNEPEHGSDEPDSSQQQGAELDGHVESDEQAAEKQPESSRLRRVFTAENIGATGTIAGAINTAAMTGIHTTPDGLIGLGVTILGLAALGVGKLEKRRKEKDERPN